MTIWQWLEEYYNEESEWTPLVYVYSIEEERVIFNQPMSFLLDFDIVPNDIINREFDSFEFGRDKNMLRFNVK